MLRGKSDWDDKLSSGKNNDVSTPKWEHVGNQTDDYQTGAVFLKCPKCEKVDTPNAIRNSAKNLDHHLKCKHCNKTSICANWKCSCDDRWWMCEIHRNQGKPAPHSFRKRTAVAKTSVPSKRPKKHTEASMDSQRRGGDLVQAKNRRSEGSQAKDTSC